MMRIFWGLITAAAVVTGGMVWQQQQPETKPDTPEDSTPSVPQRVNPIRQNDPVVESTPVPAPAPAPETTDPSTLVTNDTTPTDADADPVAEVTQDPDPLVNAVVDVFTPGEVDPLKTDVATTSDAIVDAVTDALTNPEPDLSDIVADTSGVGSDEPLVGDPISATDDIGELLATSTTANEDAADDVVITDDPTIDDPGELATFPDLNNSSSSAELDDLANDLLSDANAGIEEATTETPAPVTDAAEGSAEASMVEQGDGSFLVNDRFVIRGEGTSESPYVISWDLLTSAQETYRPREEMTALPSWVELLNGKVVRLTGFMAIPIWAESTDEMLLMLNEWDGCCIGVPPTPYDAIEVKLAEEIGMETQRYSYGHVTGTFKVDPYIANNWLIGLYVIENGSAAVN